MGHGRLLPHRPFYQRVRHGEHLLRAHLLRDDGNLLVFLRFFLASLCFFWLMCVFIYYFIKFDDFLLLLSFSYNFSDIVLFL